MAICKYRESIASRFLILVLLALLICSTAVGEQSPDKPDDRNKQSEEIVDKNHHREQSIKEVSEQVLTDLKKQDALPPNTIYLKSGKEMQCTILEELEIHLKIRYRDITMDIAREKIERIETKKPKSVEAELRKMALEKAKKIVDGGLVRYGPKWITPEERARLRENAKIKEEQDDSPSEPVSEEESVLVLSIREPIPDFVLPGAIERYSFDEIVPLLQSPRLISIFMKNNIVYSLVWDKKAGGNEYAPARVIYERGADDCDGHATLQAYLLKANGYEAYNVGLNIHSPNGHNVAAYGHAEDLTRIWSLDVSGKMAGPFSSWEELAEWHEFSGGTIWLFDPFSINEIITDFDKLPITIIR